MTCYVNGGNPLVPTSRQVRNILTLRDECTAATPIARSYAATYEVQMEQVTFHLESTPTVSQVWTLSILRTGVTGLPNPTWYNTVLRQVDMFTAGDGGTPITDLVCVIPFRWHPEEIISITFANPENFDGGSQFDGIEVIP